jgi:hypothetical protein
MQFLSLPVRLSICVPWTSSESASRFPWNSVESSCHWGPRSRALHPVPKTIRKWRTFKLLRRMKNLHHSTWVHTILHTDRSSNDEQLARLFCEETKYTNVVACLKLKFIPYFMKTTHKLLHFVRCSKYSWTWRSFYTWWWYEMLKLRWHKC